jgi:hypothetical protein
MQELRRTKKGYPLGLLFILVAFSATLMAMFSTLFRGESIERVGSKQLADALLSGVLLGMCVGTLIGLHHYWRRRGAAWGCVTGVLVGGVSLPIMLIPIERMLTVALAGVGGAILLLVIGVLMRGYSRPAAVETTNPEKPSKWVGEEPDSGCTVPVSGEEGSSNA